jgi:hypothetical protein
MSLLAVRHLPEKHSSRGTIGNWRVRRTRASTGSTGSLERRQTNTLSGSRKRPSSAARRMSHGSSESKIKAWVSQPRPPTLWAAGSPVLALNTYALTFIRSMQDTRLGMHRTGELDQEGEEIWTRTFDLEVLRLQIDSQSSSDYGPGSSRGTGAEHP